MIAIRRRPSLKDFHTADGKGDRGLVGAKQDLSEKPGVAGVRENVPRPAGTADSHGSGTGNGLYWKVGKEAARAAY